MPQNETLRVYSSEQVKGLTLTRARSEVGLSRLPVTEEIAGSNPVGPAKHKFFRLSFDRVLQLIEAYKKYQNVSKRTKEKIESQNIISY